MNNAMEALLRIKADVQGKPELQTLAQSVTKLGATAQASSGDLSRMSFAINRASRESGNTIAGIKAHAAALTTLRERTEIGGRAYIRLGNEIDTVRARLDRLTQAEQRASRMDLRGIVGAGAGSLAMGGGIGGAMGGMAGAAAAAGPVGMAVAGTALAAGAGLSGATRAALDEESSIRRVRTLSADADELMRAIRGLSVEQGHLSTNTDAAAAAYEILSSGFSKTSDVTAILRASTLGAAGGFTDIKTVADGATSIMNSFGLEASSVTRIVDQMIQTQNDGKIVVGQYAQSIGRLAPTFAVAGLSIEEMNASVAALTAKGAPVESAISGLNQAVKSILKPTDEAAKAAAALGIDFSAAGLEAKGLGGFLQDVMVKTKGNSTALGILFSDIDGFRAVTSLTNDQLKGYNKTLQNMETLTGQAGKAAKLAVDPVKQFDNAWKDFSASAGQKVLPALTGILSTLTKIIDASGKIDLKGMAPVMAGADQTQFEGAVDPRQRRLQELARERAARLKGQLDENYMQGGVTYSRRTGLPVLRSAGSLLNDNYTVGGITYSRRTGLPISGAVLSRQTAGKRPNDPAITRLVQEATGSGAGKKPSESDINTRALLATIRFAEGTLGPTGYGVHFGGGYTPPGGAHPDRVVRAGGYASAAYGAYQFMPDTWRATGGGSMTPARQDAAALRLIRNRGVDPGQSLTRGMIDRLAPEWASFPTIKTGTSYYGQGGKSFAQIQAFYRQQVAKGGGDVAGIDLAFGRETADAEKRAREEAKRKEEKEKEEKARTLAQLVTSRELLFTQQGQLAVAEAIEPLAKLNAQHDLDRTERMARYAGLLTTARSDEEKRNYLGAQSRDIAGAEVTYRNQLKEITDDQLAQEQKRVDLLQQSMDYMRDLSTRGSLNDGFKQGMASYVDSVGNLRDATAALTRDSLGGLSQAVTDLAVTGSGNFRAFAANVLADTSRMIFQQMVLKPLLGAIGGMGGGGFELPGAGFSGAFSGGGGGGFLQAMTMPRLTSWAGGGFTGNAPRSGGLDGMGGFPAILHPQETVIDHARGGAKAGAQGPQITIYVDAKNSRSENGAGQFEALAQRLGDSVRMIIAEEQRPGGMLE